MKYFSTMFLLLFVLTTITLLVIFKIESELSVSSFITAIQKQLHIESTYCKNGSTPLEEQGLFTYRQADDVYLLEQTGEPAAMSPYSARLPHQYEDQWKIIRMQSEGVLHTKDDIFIFATLPFDNKRQLKRILHFEKETILSQNKSRFYIYYLLMILSSVALSIVFTYLKKKQDEIRIREQKYLERLRSKNQELRGRNREYREAIHTKNRFFSIIAHDLRNPFQVVLGYTGLLLDNSDNMSIEEIKEYFRDIESATGLLMRLLDNLLLWSRAETGAMKMKPTSIDMQSLVDTTISLVQVNASKKEVTLQSHLASHCIANGDKDMLLTVLRNLMTNAVKFTPSGGKVTVDAFPVVENTMLEIVVKDTGIGMSPENVKKLFRVDTIYSHKGTNGEEGTGLGLVLCHEFVEKHGGRIWVESIEGEGSEFHFTIPHELPTVETNEPTHA